MAEKNRGKPPDISASILISDLIKSEQRKGKILERIGLFATLTFGILVAVIGWWTEGKVFTDTWEKLVLLDSGETGSRDITINCKKPANKKMPYCVERDSAIQQEWEGVSKYNLGKQTRFSLHGR